MSVHDVDLQRSAAAFLEGWSPERLLRHWIDEVSALGVCAANAVQTIAITRAVAEPHDVHGQRRLEWWPTTNPDELRQRAQRRCATLPWSELNQDAQSGEHQTLEYLLEATGDAERCGAVLLSASLVARVERSRARYPREAWPHFTVAQTLLKWTRAQHMYRWDARCTSTLPAHDSESGLVLGSMPQLVRFLAVEHARVLHRWTPVHIVTSDERDTSVRHSFVSVSQTLVVDEPHPAPTHSLRVTVDGARKRWFSLSKQELEALIWSKPQRSVAKEFGVSEATVAKRCKALEITKPERGFWTRPRATLGERRAANDNSVDLSAGQALKR